ncbi:MAG: putative ABC transporter permease subunit [Gemmatimonadaceae bacterium]
MPEAPPQAPPRRYDAGATLTPLGSPVVGPVAQTDASLFHLLLPKWLSAKAGATARQRGKAGRVLVLALLTTLFWGLILGVLIRLLQYFKGIPEIGALMAGKLLGLIVLSFFSILLLSNIITALSSFYLARDLDLLASAPVDWLRLYGAKLVETFVHSSWMVTLMAVPIFGAYGYVYDGGPLFPLIALAAFLPFLLIPTVLGSAITTILVNVFPARRTRDILSLIAVLAAAGLVVLFRLLRPEQLARPEGFRSLVDFVALLRGPTSPMLPSEWTQRGVMSWLTGEPDVLPFYLLWSTAAAMVVMGAAVHRALYAPGFTKAQESGERWLRGRGTRRVWTRLLAPLGVLRRELVLKEVRVFFRDTTQWSQLILLAVLVVVYVFNVKFLPLRGEGVTFFLLNLIPFLNLVLAGFVLASIAARFIFPSVSLEGRTLWLLRSSPMPVSSLLWAKYWTGTLPLLGLALAIVGVTNALLQVSAFMMAVSVATIIGMTFALAGMALGLGVLFPQFRTENAAQIPTSFGGLVYMMLAVLLIGSVVVLEARPVYSYLSARTFGGSADPAAMLVGFGLAFLLCAAATVLPLSVARRRLEEMEA